MAVIDIRLVESLVKHIDEALPGSLKQARDDLRTNLRPLVEAWLREQQLVTREEFEVQRALLERLHARLDALETQLRDA